MPLFAIPPNLAPPASKARELYEQDQLDPTITYCENELAVLARRIPAKSRDLPQANPPASAAYQFYAITLIMTDALAERSRWTEAKEALGRYRVHFPRDPWGFHAGAEVTRRDPDVHDAAAVQRAVELLEGEAHRLSQKPG